MMFMICWRVTPSLAVRMTITSVVLGDGALEGGWADGDCDCATAANGYAERINGSKSFMDAPRINVCRLLGFWVPLRLGSSRSPARTDQLVFSNVFTAYIRALAAGSAPSRAPVDTAEEPGTRGRA